MLKDEIDYITVFFFDKRMLKCPSQLVAPGHEHNALFKMYSTDKDVKLLVLYALIQNI